MQVRHRGVQRLSGFCDRQGLGNNPQAVLPAFQTRLAIGDQCVEEILFRLVEETKVGTPGYHVTNDVDTGLLYLGCHQSHLHIFNFASLLDLSSAGPCLGQALSCGSRPCLEHHEASRSIAASRRMISAVQYEWFAKPYYFCPALSSDNCGRCSAKPLVHCVTRGPMAMTSTSAGPS